MFSRKTVFIVGAGASFEIGMPLGPRLAELISKKCDIRFEFPRKPIGSGDLDLFNAICSRKQERDQEILKAAWIIRDGIHMANSIDDFLHLHRSNDLVVQYGKAAIAKCILDEERNSSIYFDQNNSYNSINYGKNRDTWLLKFIKMAGKNISTQDIDFLFRNTSFIIFNYDRSFEYFMENSIQKLYDVSREKSLEICRTAEIIHPYGKVGSLPGWDSINQIQYGSKIHGGNLVDVSTQIQTYTEQLDKSHKSHQIKNEIESASRIIFLGFGFHSQNISLLRCEKKSPDLSVYATSFGVSEPDRESITEELLEIFPTVQSENFRNRFFLRADLTCSKLFDEFSRTFPY